MMQVGGGEKSRANICVVGCGYWGKNLIRNFAELGRLTGICDTNAESLAKFTAQYPGVKCCSSLQMALDDPEIDALALATPAEQHHRMAVAALRAGKDVFVEKPLALTAEDGASMVEAAQASGRILMVGHLLRYHPAVEKLQQMVSDGVLGRIDYIYSNRLSMGKIRQEENALWSFAPHDISVILSLVGQMPVQVTATGGAYLQPNIADVTISNLLFDRGTRSHIFVSWLHPYKEQRLVVVGSKQMVVFEDTRPEQKLTLFDKRIEWKNGAIQAAGSSAVPVEFAAEEPLRRECQHFIDCIVRRVAPLTPGEEGVRVLRVLEACQRSLQMNGEPVQVNAAGIQKLAAI
jgi:UDP-2-acetamido-3-amino-2,3-dideoxy-glucuronate N-acetyltransferase